MSQTRALETLTAGFSEPVRDPLWGNILFTPGLAAIVSSPPFAKLGRIRQLGPAHLVYPGATHTRRAHSIGVYHVALRLARALAAQGSMDSFAPERLMSYLVAALCHDLGHFPFAHSLKELPLEEHEALTARAILAEPLFSLVRASGADPEFAAAIVDGSRPENGDLELRFFRGLLSGVLDPDKLDYLNRDAFFCGVPYGLQDVDFILQRVRVGPGDSLAIDEKGIMSVESLLFAKYLMYRSVYWHRDVRSATAMIKKALSMALEEGAIKPEELYGLDDDGFHARLRSIPFAPFALADSVFEGRIYAAFLDLPFDEGDPRHAGIADLSLRLRVEEELAVRGGLGSLDVIVDLPEPISFETDLTVLASVPGAESLPFSESPSVFSPPVVAGFARSLRRLRVFASEPSPALSRSARERFG
ncbi:MAG: HD domain-containing protein [Spirochaetaceae bacterium]|nr:HD domain-containing protein [Spirochaetaceae bacterium]